MKPVAVDLCCGLGGWTEGLLSEGWDVVGFDVERHQYGEHQYPAQLVLQDILTLDGRQFRGRVSLIVASPPCQKFSYMAMPWTRAKALAIWYRDPEHPERLTELTALFDACVRIGREAGCPCVIENVRGAQPWVGRSKWNFGSYHLWGDVPALMPMTHKGTKLGGGLSWAHPDDPRHTPGLNFTRLAGLASEDGRRTDVGKGVRFTSRDCGDERGQKNTGGSWFAIGSPGQKVVNSNPVHDGVKQPGIGGARENGKGDAWFQDGAARHGSKSRARKAASARIAKIPFALASFIAYTYFSRVVAA